MMGASNPVIAKAMAEFPRTFALRSQRHRIFRISDAHSYVNDNGEVQLYTEILTVSGEWLSYAKATPSELALQILPITDKAWDEAHSGGAVQFKPEEHKLGGWRKSVIDSLAAVIGLHAEDCDALPSVDEYREMARHALETSVIKFGKMER